MRFIFFLAFFAVFYSSFAQQTDINPCFSTEYKKACVPFTLSPKDCSGADAKLIYYDYGDGKGPIPSKSHTYDKIGKYFITQYINPSTGTGGKQSDGTYFIEIVSPSSIDFEVVYCQNNTISLQIKEPKYSKYKVDFGDAVLSDITPNVATTHTYSTSKTYTLSVSGFEGNTQSACGFSQKDIFPKERLNFGKIENITVLANGNVKVNFTNTHNLEYSLSYKNTLTDKKQELSLVNQTSVILPLDVSTTSAYEFRLNGLEPCSKKELYSAEALNTVFLTAYGDKQKNILSWKMFPLQNALVGFFIYRNNELIAKLSSQERNFTDINVKCSQTYNYRVEAHVKYSEQEMLSISNDAQAAAQTQTNLSALDVSVSVEKSQILLNWQVPQGSLPEKIFLYKAKNDEDFKNPIEIPIKSPYIDVQTNADQTLYRYKLSYQDACGNLSPISQETSTILLKLTKTDTEVHLTWENKLLLQFELEKLDKKGNILTSIPINANTYMEKIQDLMQQENYYRIRSYYNTSQGKKIVYSNEVKTIANALLLFPNAFSPNGDGLNDTFYVTTKFIKTFYLQIFNRWGNLLFETEDFKESWNGYFLGEIVPAGEYVYTLRVVDEIGRKVEKRGILNLIQ